MNLLNLFRRGSAPVARERLQILLAHERKARNEPDLLDTLREEIMEVIGRHVSFEPDKVLIKVDRGKCVSTLAVDIEIPNGLRPTGVAPPLGKLVPDQPCDDDAPVMQQGAA